MSERGVHVQQSEGRVRRFLAHFAMTVLSAALINCAAQRSFAADPVEVRIGLLGQVAERPPKLSNLDVPPDNEGLAGGELSVKDNNTTGRFLGQKFSLKAVSVPPDGDVLNAFDELVQSGIQFVVLNVSADRLIAIADKAKAQDVLLFNAGAPDDRLRGEACRANVMHIVPSRSMLADGLAQYLIWKRWTKWFLVTGRRDGDKLYADAVRRAAKKFGGKIVEEKIWDYGPDARRTAQAEVPKFTQGANYDVMIVADEIGEFGEYLAYRTWSPRPVAGTQGLVPTSWHRTHEQWGAAQLQKRFFKTYKRRMTALDYNVWAPIRLIGEGATRTNSGEFARIRDYIRGDDLELAGFKGQKLTFRPWNWQLRQPILLAAPRAMVSVSPQQGFLHQHSQLDTLGADKPEAKCTF
ncbi:MAG: ABC transporter substrate-binding protein [Hyphomicrobiaceae bacterium]